MITADAKPTRYTAGLLYASCPKPAIDQVIHVVEAVGGTARRCRLNGLVIEVREARLRVIDDPSGEPLRMSAVLRALDEARKAGLTHQEERPDAPTPSRSNRQ